MVVLPFRFDPFANGARIAQPIVHCFGISFAESFLSGSGYENRFPGHQERHGGPEGLQVDQSFPRGEAFLLANLNAKKKHLFVDMPPKLSLLGIALEMFDQIIEMLSNRVHGLMEVGVW